MNAPLKHHPRFLTAYGSRDSHAVTLASGEPNRSHKAGSPYETIDWPSIVARADAPTATDKNNAQFIVPSSTHDSEGRNHAHQRANGRFHMLAIDIDEGSPSLGDLQTALRAVVGNVETLIYSSSGATPDRLKWRALVPLAEPIDGADYADTQTALFRLLSGEGIVCDTTLNRAAQPVYLPNVPPEKRGPDGTPLFYVHQHIQAPRLRLSGASPVIIRRGALRDEREREQRAADLKREEHAQRRLAYVQATGDDFDPIQHFKASNTVADMLARYGFEKARKGNDWKSPLSSSGSYSTKDYGDYWVVVSAWADNYNLGRETRSGARAGDAFDLYAFFDHGGDKRAAIRAYSQQVRPDGPQGPNGGQRPQAKPTEKQHPPVWPAPTGDRETALGKTRAHIAKWAEKSRVAATAVRDVADRYGELDELLEPKERAKAQMAIRRAVKDAMGLDYLPTASWRKGDTSLRHMVTGAQGVGKTFALVGGRMDGRDHRGALHEGYGLVSVFYSSDHTQSAQAFSDYQVGYRPKTDPIGIQALGRTAQHPTDPTKTACELGKQTRKAAAKGVNIQKAFCRECPFASGCAYLERVRDIEAATKSPQGAVVFGVHEHAFTKMAGVDRADRHIFDERVRAFKEATYSIAIDDWHRDLSEYLDWTGQSAGQTADALADSLTIKRVRTEIGRAVTERPADALQAIKEALQPLTPKGGSVSDFLRQTVGKLQQFNADRLQERIAGEIKAFSFSVADGRRGASLESRLDKQLDAADENHVRNLAKIMQAVALDIEQDHFPHLTTVYVTQINKAQRIAALVVEKTTIPENAPLLHLDGTGEGEIANAWLGPTVRHHFPVERLTKSAIMVDGHHFSNSALTGEGYKGAPYYPERAAVVRAKLRRIIDRTPNAFLAAPKRAIELLGETSAKVSLWYGALRGSNLAKDCETAIIVGRNLPSVGEVEAKARAIAAALNRPFTPIPSGGPTGTLWPRRDEYIRLADGTTYPINVEYHPDPTAQMVVRQIRDAEAAQALDRVRAQYQTRSFIIMGACIPDLTFTEVKAWRNMAEGGTRMERCIEQHGVIPLSPAEAFNIAPHFWGSLSTAKKDKEIQTVKAGMSGNLWSGQMVLNRYLIHDDPTKESACLVAYKRLTKGRGGNTSEHHAVVIGRPSQARLILERVTGALADFRVVDYNDAAHAMDLAEHHAARIAAQVQDMPPENITPLPRPVAKPAPVRPPLRVTSGAGPPFPD